MRDRAQRRFQQAKRKHKAKQIVDGQISIFVTKFKKADLVQSLTTDVFDAQTTKGKLRQYNRTVGMRARTPRLCSCWMCGNKRRHWGAKHSEKVRHMKGMDDE
jgi:hypothetical protein